jgi:nucleoside-diphosphate-sugar epimerase
MSAKSGQPILVTGGAGYIGSVLVRKLLAHGRKVRVADSLRWGGESLVELVQNPNFEFYRVDIRDREALEPIVSGCSAVAHLAAIVGDPACKKEPELAKSTNVNGSKQLFELANRAGCEKFIFASTCSNYGKMKDSSAYVDETSELAPVSLYAETKVNFEQFLLVQPRSSACRPTCLRFSTVYGFSPRMRFDLTVNEFTRELALNRELVVFGEQFWRPYCHVDDLAASVLTVLNQDSSMVGFEVFNVGDTSENYTKEMIINEIRKRLPAAKVRFVEKNEDPRDYRVNFDRIRDHLGFTISKRVGDGVAEIIKLLRSGLMNNPDDKRFSNT